MKTPLVRIEILSIYEHRGERILLPKRMAQCTPDTQAAIDRIADDVHTAGGKLYLSDLFRSYDMQLQAHLDWKTGKKKAFSPPPGGSMHEAGRAFDLSLKDLKVKLNDFWQIAQKYGVSPIIGSPDPRKNEAWHFECRGSHAKVYAYYKAGKGTNFREPYRAMAASCLLAIGVEVNKFGTRQKVAYLQSCLVRLGHELGNIDGYVGVNTKTALVAASLDTDDLDAAIAGVEAQLQELHPEEFRIQIETEAALFDYSKPEHVRIDDD